uniref:G-patch domain-containing protein n=1 Tax=Heliothis virescens TaxID=7102 RepID=A0A2A4J8Q6_HELVI
MIHESPMDEVPSKRKFQQAPDQYAVDEHGRRRFHGAFTGGFSAGFGNTVGSQEGWTPSSFKSSRSEKAMFSNQRPEDFMDEEDRGEFGIAPRHVGTHSEFSGHKRPRAAHYHDGPIPGEPVLQQLVRAVHETAAVRMLRAMGWREGQGTGERLSKKDKDKAKDQHKVYGCYIPTEFRQNAEKQDEESPESSDSEFDFDTLFAPDDYEPYILHRKSDRFGLGYSGLSRHSVLGNLVGEYGSEAGSSRSHLVMKDKGKRVSIRGQAFGVGAFEADDEDIYATQDMSHYDFAIGGPDRDTKLKKPAQDKSTTRFRESQQAVAAGEPVLQQLVRAVHETAAVRMLRAMGWREGQGTGERLSKKDKDKAKDQHKVYGCYIPTEFRQNAEKQDEESPESSDSEFDFDTLFAPDDYEPYILHRKSDRFGLGYSGLSRHSVLGNLVGEYGSEAGSSRSHLVMKDKGKRVSIRGQAFGVGAFEADDEDIYATQDMSHYDFAIGGPDRDTKLKKPAQDKSGHVLPGFVKASKPLPPVPSYPAPALPRDYVPAAAGARRSRFEPTSHAPRDQGLGRHELSAKARGEILGEAPIPTQTTPPIHTPAHTPTQPNDAVTKLLGRNVNFVTYTDDKPLDYIPIKDSGKELVKVFKPFAGNPEKQTRYENYVKNNGVVERDGDMDKLQEWERERELVEFEQAAKLYKPLSGIMGDRFTHATEPDEALNPLCAVAKSSANHGLATKEQIEAAKQGVYGLMTRQESTWRPESLVAKRFNVPEIGGARADQKKEDRPKVSYSIFSYLESSVHDKDSFAKEQTKFSGSKSLTTNILPKKDTPAQKSDQINKQTDQNTDQSKDLNKPSDQTPGFSKRMTVAELFLKESEKTKDQGAEVTDTINQFDKMDLYKSIFLSDSEEEIDNEDKTKNNEATDFVDKPKNVERNTSPPRGIFANIDFDELNSWRRKDETPKLPKPSEDSTKKVETVETNDEAMYGPKIPENLQKRLQETQNNNAKEAIDVNSSSSEDSWVDINEINTKKHKKKKSKKHKSKHKKKSKSKKKDR